MRDRRDLGDRLVLQAPVHLAHAGEVRHAEGDLVDRVEGQVGRPPARHHHLVVLARIAAQEHELQAAARCFEIAAVGDGKTEHACVKILHARDVGHENPHVAE